MSLPDMAQDEEHMPDMAIGIYDGFVCVDHERRRCEIRAQDTEAGRRWATRMKETLSTPQASSPPSFVVLGNVRPNLEFTAYARAFNAVQDYIRAGDCYHINLAMRFSAPCSGHPWSLYLALRERNPAPYAAWMNFPFGQVLSSSPESFLSLKAGQVTTRPIKGTRPRGRDPHEDERLSTELAASAKDRAENLMIVDLLRNDLGKVCVPGSIEVPELFRVESFATVHHLVSTVTGRLAQDKTAVDLLAAAFPGGSITGAPKQRAMEIIESLEPSRRGVYCGALGYLGLDGSMELNIAIRTLVCSNGRVRYWVGGGLVADSDVLGEYQECLDKGRAMQEVLDGFRFRSGDGGRIP
jgi:para-aminobenzoate synthetase component 1